MGEFYVIPNNKTLEACQCQLKNEYTNYMTKWTWESPHDFITTQNTIENY